MKRAAILVALAACYDPDCYLEIADGSQDNIDGIVHPADVIGFQAHVGERRFDCGGLWIVNGLVGGSEGLGTIDSCGHYVAPASFPAGLVAVEIEAIFPGHTGCESMFSELRPAE